MANHLASMLQNMTDEEAFQVSLSNYLLLLLFIVLRDISSVVKNSKFQITFLLHYILKSERLSQYTRGKLGLRLCSQGHALLGYACGWTSDDLKHCYIQPKYFEAFNKMGYPNWVSVKSFSANISNYSSMAYMNTIIYANIFQHNVSGVTTLDAGKYVECFRDISSSVVKS